MAVTLKNIWHRALSINVQGRKEPLRIMSRGTVEVNAKEMESPELKNLIASGDIRVLASARVKEPVAQVKEPVTQANEPAKKPKQAS